MASSGDYLFWNSATHYVSLVGFVSSLFFGSILLLLNYYGAQKILGTYKYLISTFTLLGVIFATTEIIVYPNVHNYQRGFLFFSFTESFGLSGSRTKNIPLAGYTFFYSVTVALLSVQFIYRYWAVFNQQKLIYFQGSNIIIWIAYCAYFGFQYALGVYFFLELDPISIEYFREEMLVRYYVNMTEFPATAMLAYDPVDGSVRWWNVMGVVNICFIITIQYGVMIYCGWAMHTKMEEKIANFSPELGRHHKQFFKTLVIQITAPTLILFAPLSFVILLPFFDLDISIPSGVFLTSLTWYPAMDAIIVMCLVSEYRKTAKEIWARINTNSSRVFP